MLTTSTAGPSASSSQIASGNVLLKTPPSGESAHPHTTTLSTVSAYDGGTQGALTARIHAAASLNHSAGR